MDRGELTPAQARKLISQTQEAASAAPEAEPEEELGLSPEAQESLGLSDEELGFAPDDGFLVGDSEPDGLQLVEDDEPEVDDVGFSRALGVSHGAIFGPVVECSTRLRTPFSSSTRGPARSVARRRTLVG